MSFLREVPICSYFFWLGVEFDILFVSFFSSCSKKTKQNVIDEVLGRKPTSNFSTLALWAFFFNIFLDRWSDTFGCPTYCQKRKRNVVCNKTTEEEYVCSEQWQYKWYWYLWEQNKNRSESDEYILISLQPITDRLYK